MVLVGLAGLEHQVVLVGLARLEHQVGLVGLVRLEHQVVLVDPRDQQDQVVLLYIYICWGCWFTNYSLGQSCYVSVVVQVDLESKGVAGSHVVDEIVCDIERNPCFPAFDA